ncbi:MAG: hypothetical protein ACTINV_14350, partial [Cellulosimicrobium funkei]
MDTELENTTDVLLTLGAVAAGVVLAFVLGTVISAVVRRAGRRSELARDLSRRLRRPDRAVLTVVAVWIAVRVTTDAGTPWRPAVVHLHRGGVTPSPPASLRTVGRAGLPAVLTVHSVWGGA